MKKSEIPLNVVSVRTLTILIAGLQKIGISVALLNHHNKGHPLLHTIKSSRARAVIVGPGKIYVTVHNDYMNTGTLCCLLSSNHCVDSQI
jgi:hypothetical protein